MSNYINKQPTITSYLNENNNILKRYKNNYNNYNSNNNSSKYIYATKEQNEKNNEKESEKEKPVSRRGISYSL